MMNNNYSADSLKKRGLITASASVAIRQRGIYKQGGLTDVFIIRAT